MRSAPWGWLTWKRNSTADWTTRTLCSAKPLAPQSFAWLRSADSPPALLFELSRESQVDARCLQHSLVIDGPDRNHERPFFYVRQIPAGLVAFCPLRRTAKGGFSCVRRIGRVAATGVHRRLVFRDSQDRPLPFRLFLRRFLLLPRIR